MNNPRMFLGAAAAAALSLVLVRGAGAQNLLDNPGFDGGLAPWLTLNSATFSTEDAAGSPASGSARMDSVAGASAYVRQCVSLPAGIGFLAASGSHRVAAGQTEGLMSFYVQFSDTPNCGTDGLVRQWTEPFSVLNAWGITRSAPFPVPPGSQSVRVEYGLYVNGPSGSVSGNFDDLRLEPTDTALLLTGDRFLVTADFDTQQGLKGRAHAVELTADSGYFWFFDQSNVELIVKVLDGCGLNQRYWVFAGGLTDVEVKLNVIDLLRGPGKTYTTAQGTPFPPIQDTSALQTCP